VHYERRRHPRVPLTVPALLDFQQSWSRARCENVSALGLAVTADLALPIGTEVELYFELPNGVAVETRAEVVRAMGQSMSMRFVDPSERCVAALGYYVRAVVLGHTSVLRAS
jgi:hypothetical protein